MSDKNWNLPIFSQNCKGYLKNHWTNTRLVCTHLNAFSCKIQIYQQKCGSFSIFKSCQMSALIICMKKVNFDDNMKRCHLLKSLDVVFMLQQVSKKLWNSLHFLRCKLIPVNAHQLIKVINLSSCQFVQIFLHNHD